MCVRAPARRRTGRHICSKLAKTPASALHERPLEGNRSASVGRGSHPLLAKPRRGETRALPRTAWSAPTVPRKASSGGTGPRLRVGAVRFGTGPGGEDAATARAAPRWPRQMPASRSATSERASRRCERVPTRSAVVARSCCGRLSCRHAGVAERVRHRRGRRQRGQIDVTLADTTATPSPSRSASKPTRSRPQYLVRPARQRHLGLANAKSAHRQ